MELDQLNLALDRICQNLGGSWLLLGGSLIRFDVDSTRGTYDLDIVPIPLEISVPQRTKFFQEMKDIGLSPDQVNSSVSFFLANIAGWENETILLKQKGAGRLYRPSLTLFAYMKLLRGTDIDIEDIRKAAQKWGAEEFDKEKFKAWADLSIQTKAQTLGLL